MTAAHWDGAYRQGSETRSWFQPHPAPSLRALDDAGANATDSVIDVGGGASTLVDALLSRGYEDLTVLDISAEGLQTAQRRVGDAAQRVTWIVDDLLRWRPERTWRVWHDRAVLHFLAAAEARAKYLDALADATELGSIAIVATFAADGPEHCSGLPVARYDGNQLADVFGDRWRQLATRRELHSTPAGSVQPFTWSILRRE